MFKFGHPWKLGNGILIPNGVVFRVLSMRGIEWRIEKVDRTTGKVRKVSLKVQKQQFWPYFLHFDAP